MYACFSREVGEGTRPPAREDAIAIMLVAGRIDYDKIGGFVPKSH